MKIAIHSRKGGFSKVWIDYCESNNISYKLVNCFASDIIQQLNDCDGLMWHWSHYDPEAVLFSRQLTYSLEHAGKKVFPDSHTCWHFDDKVGQKYMFEAINAPLVPTYVFYDKISIARLYQLAVAYNTVTALVTYVMLAQLWDENTLERPLSIKELFK